MQTRVMDANIVEEAAPIASPSVANLIEFKLIREQIKSSRNDSKINQRIKL